MSEFEIPKPRRGCRAVFIPVTGKIEVVDFGDYFDLHALRTKIDANILEFVRIGAMRIMIVDEVGKCYDPPKPVNMRASVFYPGTFYGDPIVGDVLIVGFDGSPDIIGLTDGQIFELINKFKD